MCLDESFADFYRNSFTVVHSYYCNITEMLLCHDGPCACLDSLHQTVMSTLLFAYDLELGQLWRQANCWYTPTYETELIKDIIHEILVVRKDLKTIRLASC
ncbi:hypothetical protein EMCRGX_G001661 [Ephydatia muelleri]